MTHEPLVSILMTCYNRERLIANSIESVLASSFQNWELIIVDDNSIDNTLAIAKDHARKDSRIKCYANEANIGDYKNRNQAASYATGKYIKYVDSDDTIFTHTINTMVAGMEKYPEAGFGLSIPDQKHGLKFPFLLNARDAYLMHYNQLPIFFAAPGNAIFKTDAFLAMGGFATLRMVSDFEMWHRMVLRYPVVLMPANLYTYNVHGEQERKDFANYLTLYEQLKINFLLATDSPLSIEEAKKIIGQRKLSLLKIIVKFLVTAKWKSAMYRIRVLAFYLSNSNKRNELQ